MELANCVTASNLFHIMHLQPQYFLVPLPFASYLEMGQKSEEL